MANCGVKNANTIQLILKGFPIVLFRFRNKKFEIQDDWLNVGAVGIVKNENTVEPLLSYLMARHVRYMKYQSQARIR